MSGADTDSATGTPELRTLFAAGWRSLPSLLAGSVLVCVAATLVVLFSPGVNPAAVGLAVVLVGPPAAALVWVANRLYAGDDVTVRELAAALPVCWRRGMLAGAVPAVPAALFLIGLELWTQTSQAWLLVPMSLNGAVAVVATLVAAIALPVILLPDPDTGRAAWLRVAHAVARRPIPAIGVLVVAGTGGWAAVELSASLLLLVPGPVALVAAAAAAVTTGRTAPAPLTPP